MITTANVTSSVPASAGGLQILFCTLPAFGHLYPLMPLALAARASGHEVMFATGDEFIPRLRALGLNSYSVGVSVKDAALGLWGPNAPMPDGHRPNWEVIGQLLLGSLARRTIDDMLPILDRLKPDLVVYEQYDFGAAIAAALAGVPTICHSLGRALSIEIRQILGAGRLDDLWADYHGGRLPFDVFEGHVYLDIFPQSLQIPSVSDNTCSIPMRPVPWSEPNGIVPVCIRNRSRPMAYLTLGTIRFSSGDCLHEAVSGLSTLGLDVLVALGAYDSAVLRTVAAGVHVERFVNQAEVLQHVDLVVHHGGSGTTIGALSHGLPQLILPQGADQFINADVVSSAGLGLSLESDNVTADAVIDAAKLLLDDNSYRDAAGAVCDEIAHMSHPMEILPTLIDLTNS